MECVDSHSEAEIAKAAKIEAFRDGDPRQAVRPGQLCEKTETN